MAISQSSIKLKINNIYMSEKKMHPVTKLLQGHKLYKLLLLLCVQRLKAAQILYKSLSAFSKSCVKSVNNIEKLFIAHTQVNRGHFFKRRFPRSQGRVNYIKKRTCQVIITLKYIA